MCVLGSREQLCINQEVMRQESNHVKVSTELTEVCGYINLSSNNIFMSVDFLRCICAEVRFPPDHAFTTTMLKVRLYVEI